MSTVSRLEIEKGTVCVLYDGDSVRISVEDSYVYLSKSEVDTLVDFIGVIRHAETYLGGAWGEDE